MEQQASFDFINRTVHRSYVGVCVIDDFISISSLL